jgi:hypothetical protein
MKNAQETHYKCSVCGGKVWMDDGVYSCDCREVGIYQISIGAAEFWPEWKEDETEKESVK